MPIYEVVVGNIGSVYLGSDEDEALANFREYKARSREGYGRAAAEPMTLFKDGEPEKEYDPPSDADE